MAYKRKLIEVAMPLEVINKESAREKSIRHGHPSTLHLWWARRPLAACRAVLFASLVDDPSSHPEQFPTEQAQDKERLRLFGIIEKLVKWENSNDQRVLDEARAEIMRSTGNNPPPVYDPFCGGGSIPLEAQRLGLEAHGSDLNPVAVLISKALVEIPPKFAGLAPVNPESRKMGIGGFYPNAAGLAADVAFYGEWMKKEAERRIGHLYPKAKLPEEQGGGEATVIAWLWTRTVKCPNPACGCQMPLVRSFTLSTKSKTWAEPIVEPDGKGVRFEIRSGKGEATEGTVKRGKIRCIACGTPVDRRYVMNEGQAGRMNSQLMAIVAEGTRGRVYLPTSEVHEKIIREANPSWKPDYELPGDQRNCHTQNYGLSTFADLFTDRQLAALSTFSDLIPEVMGWAYNHAAIAGMSRDDVGLADGGKGAKAYSEAIGVFLSLSIDKAADYWSSICSWHSGRDTIRNTFARQTIPMVWDYAECNPFSDSTGNWSSGINWAKKVIEELPARPQGTVTNQDATKLETKVPMLFSTDPPYYDNIGYADLSDFFYVWLKKNLSSVYPGLFRTIMTPKTDELVATTFRHEGNREKAKQHFEAGFSEAFAKIRDNSDIDYPVTVYYAFKQAEGEDDEENGEKETVSTGWETMLEGLLSNDYAVIGTWPMRSELANRPLAYETNALTSSIVIVCRPKEENAQLISRKDFMLFLRKELRWALDNLREGGIGAVDLAQAAIGPGMAVYSRYAAVLEADGNKMSVRTALKTINQELDDWLDKVEGHLDMVSSFCLAWYKVYLMGEGPYGDAEGIIKAKNISFENISKLGVIRSVKGKVSLVPITDIKSAVTPDKDLTVWACVQHMLKALSENGEEGVAEIIGKVGTSKAEAAKMLAYKLYRIAEDKRATEEALAYNSLVSSWMDIKQRAEEMSRQPSKQGTLI